MSEKSNELRHLAIILDGNGRWAKKRFLPRSAGHSAGSKNVEKVCRWAWDMGIRYLTVYAFSTENWSRSKEEVDTLMDLLRDYMKTCLEQSRKNNMRVRIIGDTSRLDEDLRQSIEVLEKESSAYTGLNFQVALNYGGRDDITRAVRSLAGEVAAGRLLPEDITEKKISEALDTGDIPDPDLLIRTGGEQRISNFLLWQCAYTEFYYTDVFWPDFDKSELEKAVAYFNGRDRRFGGRNGE